MPRTCLVLPGLAVSLLAAAGVFAQARADETITASGRLIYVDEKGDFRPLARVIVQLMDQDPDFDEVLARGITDRDGAFKLTGRGGDDLTIGQSRPDVHVKKKEAKQAAEPSMTEQRLVRLDAAAAVPLRWTTARLARLPAALRAPMKRIQDKRVALFGAWDAEARAAHREALGQLPVATEESLLDGSHEKKVAALRAALLTRTASLRLSQLAELKTALEPERSGTTDKALQRYVDGLLRRYDAQEKEIRAAVDKPGSRIPEVLLPRSLGARLTSAGAAKGRAP